MLSLKDVFSVTSRYFISCSSVPYFFLKYHLYLYLPKKVSVFFCFVLIKTVIFGPNQILADFTDSPSLKHSDLRLKRTETFKYSYKRDFFNVYLIATLNKS